MIADLSLSLRALLAQAAALDTTQIVFDHPGEPFAPGQTTLDLFLYDIRENRDLGPPVPQSQRSLACTYLITAWPVGGAELALQEQELLGRVLMFLAGNPTIPARLLHGALAGHTPLPQLLPLHPEAVQSSAEFWTALGNRLRPSISLIVTLALPISPFLA